MLNIDFVAIQLNMQMITLGAAVTSFSFLIEGNFR